MSCLLDKPANTRSGGKCTVYRHRSSLFALLPNIKQYVNIPANITVVFCCCAMDLCPHHFICFVSIRYIKQSFSVLTHLHKGMTVVGQLEFDTFFTLISVQPIPLSLSWFIKWPLFQSNLWCNKYVPWITLWRQHGRAHWQHIEAHSSPHTWAYGWMDSPHSLRRYYSGSGGLINKDTVT